MATPDATLKELLAAERPDAAKIAAFLDGLDHGGRMTAITALQGQKEQAKLYEINANAPAVTMAELVPVETPPGWPDVKRNDQGLTRFENAKKLDYLRRVSKHVLIGRAHKGGKEMPNWFLLCREA